MNLHNIIGSLLQHPKYLKLIDDALVRAAYKYDRAFGFCMDKLHQSYKRNALKSYTYDNLLIEATANKNKDILLAFLTKIPYNIDISEEQADSIVKHWIWNASTNKILPEADTRDGLKYLDTVKSYMQYSGDSTVVLDIKKEKDKVEELLRELNPKRDFTTGIPLLDDSIQGGLGRQELGLLQADTNVGKTWYVLNIALANAIRGYNVMFVSLEMGEKAMLTRLGVLLLKKSSTVIESQEDKVIQDYLNNIDVKLKGNFILIKELPRKFTVHDLEQKYQECILSYGYTPDLIVLDYADLFAMPAGKSRWEAVGDIYNQLKSFAMENNIGIWTAGQLVRGAGEKEVTTTSDTAGSYDKARIADLILNLEDSGDGSKKIRIQKTRTAGIKQAIVLHPDFTTGDLVGVDFNNFLNIGE